MLIDKKDGGVKGDNDGGYATGRKAGACVIDDKDQPLDEENSGFGGNAKGIYWRAMGLMLLQRFFIPSVSFGDTRGELLNVSGKRSADGGERARIWMRDGMMDLGVRTLL